MINMNYYLIKLKLNNYIFSKFYPDLTLISIKKIIFLNNKYY